MHQELMATVEERANSYRLISYEELKQHCLYSDAWISLNGTVYDITQFIPKHPFGDTFRGLLGTECGGLFSSAHCHTKVEEMIRNDKFLRRNDIAVVGQLDASRDHLSRGNDKSFLDRIVYRETNQDEFWLELKATVTSYLKQRGESIHYTFREGLMYILYYLSLYAVLSYLTWMQGLPLAAILLGFHMVCALTNISHMATHYGFTRSQPLNFIAMYFYDLSGMSGLEWQIAHQTHHHQPHSSLDYQTNAYDYIGIRLHKYMKRKRHHRYQHIYFWGVVSVYLTFKLVATTAWLFANREFVRHRYEMAAHIIARGVLLAQVTYCACTQGYWTALLLFALYAIAFSQTAFILLFNDHEETHAPLGEEEDVAHFHGRLSWAEVQVRTSGNWYPTNWLLAFVEFHYGYFNYHIEHHLFPTLKPRLLKEISPLVKGVCEKHGIMYVSTPFLAVQRSLQSHLVNMGAPEVPPECSPGAG